MLGGMRDLYKYSASLTKRGLAFLLDLIILNWIVFAPFEGILTTSWRDSWQGWAMVSVPPEVYGVAVSVSILSLLYFALFESMLGQTVGMMVLGLYSEGNMTFWTSIIRNLFIVPFFPFFLLWIVEPLYLFFRGERWLERVTHTRTVEWMEYSP